MDESESVRAGLLAVIGHSAEPMVFSDPRLADNPIVAVNAGFMALTGYAEAEIVGRNCRFLQGPKTDRETVGKIGACLRAGQGCIQWLANYRRDGSEFYNLLFMSPVFGAGGKLLFFFANQHDLTLGGPDLPSFPIGPAHHAAGNLAAFQQALLTAGREGVPAVEARLAAERAAFLSTRMVAGSGADET